MIHLTSIHFSKNCRIALLNSMDMPDKEKSTFENFQAYLKKFINGPAIENIVINVPKQTNGFDCGVYLLYYVKTYFLVLYYLY